MKTRFRKVWCSSCGTMQFAGECGHITNTIGPAPEVARLLAGLERIAPPWLSGPTPNCKCIDCQVKRAREAGSTVNWELINQLIKESPLILPAPTEWREYKVDASGKNGPELFPFILGVSP